MFSINNSKVVRLLDYINFKLLFPASHCSSVYSYCIKLQRAETGDAIVIFYSRGKKVPDWIRWLMGLTKQVGEKFLLHTCLYIHIWYCKCHRVKLWPPLKMFVYYNISKERGRDVAIYIRAGWLSEFLVAWISNNSMGLKLLKFKFCASRIVGLQPATYPCCWNICILLFKWSHFSAPQPFNLRVPRLLKPVLKTF